MKKAVFITGASSGIGLEIVKQLSKKGSYEIFGTYLSEEDKAPLKTIDNVHPVKMDVTNKNDIDNAIKYVTEKVKGKGLFALINNAGIQYMMPFECYDEDMGRFVAEVDFFSIITISRKFLPLMKIYSSKHNDNSRILNTGSLSNYLVSPYNGYYSAMKQALNGLTQTMAFDLGYINIHASVANVGITKTPIASKNKEAILKNKENLSKEQLEIYGTFFDSAISGLDKTAQEKGGLGIGADKVAKKMISIIESRKPKSVYDIGMDTKAMKFIDRYLPTQLKSFLYKKMFGLK